MHAFSVLMLIKTCSWQRRRYLSGRTCLPLWAHFLILACCLLLWEHDISGSFSFFYSPSPFFPLTKGMRTFVSSFWKVHVWHPYEQLQQSMWAITKMWPLMKLPYIESYPFGSSSFLFFTWTGSGFLELQAMVYPLSATWDPLNWKYWGFNVGGFALAPVTVMCYWCMARPQESFIRRH